MKLNPKHFILTMTTFIAIVYITCAALVSMAPITSMKVANTIFHGIDLTEISKTVSFLDIFYGFIVSIVATVIYSFIFVTTWNYLYERMEVKQKWKVWQ